MSEEQGTRSLLLTVLVFLLIIFTNSGGAYMMRTAMSILSKLQKLSYLGVLVLLRNGS